MGGRGIREAAFWGPLVLAALLIALWPPHTVDGPAHVLGASVLADWDAEPAFRAVYERDLTPTPNLGGNLVLAVLLKLFGMRAGETVLLVGCAVGLPLALRAAVAAVRPENGWAAIAALPFGFGYLYFYGFYGFCLGLALFLCCVAVALRAPRSIARTVVLAALLTATWFTHLVPFALAIGTAGLLALARSRSPRDLAWAAVPMLPGLVLTAAYALRTEQGAGPEWLAPPGLVAGLIGLHSPLVALSTTENVVAAGLAVLFAAVAIATRRDGWAKTAAQRPAVRGLAWAALATVVLYLAAPKSLGTDFGLINERLSLFPVLLGLLWLIARPIPARATATVAIGSLLATGALLAVRAPELRRIDRLADEYATAARLLPKEPVVFVALRFAQFSPDAGRNRNADPIRHLSNLLAARTGSVDVGHYEAVLDYFPARFGPSSDYRRLIDPDLDRLGQVPPRIDVEKLSEYQFRYVLVIGAAAARTPDAQKAVAETRDRLRKRWVRVGATEPTGLVEVWRARSPG